MFPDELKAPADEAERLIHSLKNGRGTLPPFQGDVLRRCANNINKIVEESKQLNKSSDELPAPKRHRLDDSGLENARTSVVLFIKRCCTAYLLGRLDIIKKMRWKYGGIVPESAKENFTRAERDWLTEYNKLIVQYQVHFGARGVNLLNALNPPRNLYIPVKSNQDLEQFEVVDGSTYVINKNSVHFLPQMDCDMLMKQGVFELALD